MVIHRAPTRSKPMAHRPAAGGASANLDRGLARQRLPMAAVALTVEAPLRRAIARARPTAVDTGRVLRTTVAMAATPEAARRRAIARARPTAVDTGRVLRTAVAMAATAEGAPCQAIAPAPATAVAVDTDQALRMAAEVLLAVAAARIAAVEAASMVVAEAASIVVAEVAPMVAEEEGAADFNGNLPGALRERPRTARPCRLRPQNEPLLASFLPNWISSPQRNRERTSSCSVPGT